MKDKNKDETELTPEQEKEFGSGRGIDEPKEENK